jgi:outer membrane protein OmpA-like peptidoglycan-associated protein
MATHDYNILIHVFDQKSDIELGFHGGIMNNFRLSNSLDLHIDLTAVAAKWSFDDNTYDTWSQWHRAHFDFSGMVGLMWYLGGRTLDVATTEEIVSGDCSKQEARINELIDQVNGLQDELDDCRKNGTTVHDTVYVTRQGEVISYPFSVFFNKGSYELRDGRDRINLQEIAQAAINHNLVVNLRGTCDAATASAAFNKTLAENRCNKIKNELVKIGVPADNIVINAVGGVSELKPAEYDRRVFITFSEK